MKEKFFTEANISNENIGFIKKISEILCGQFWKAFSKKEENVFLHNEYSYYHKGTSDGVMVSKLD